MASSTGVVPKPVVTILMLFIGCLLLDSVVFVGAKEGGDRPTGKSSIAKSNAGNLDVSGVADAGFGGAEGDDDENPSPSQIATGEEEDQNVVAAEEVEHPASPVAAGHDQHHLLEKPAGSSRLHVDVGGHGGGNNNNNHGVHQGQHGVQSSPESGKPMSPSGHGHRSSSPSKTKAGDSGSGSPPHRSGSPPRHG